MLDKEEVIEVCDCRIEEILNELDVDYKIENGWLSMPCCFHKGDKYNLKYKNKSFYCFSECRRNYNIIDVVSKIMDVDFYESLCWLADFVGVNNTSKEDLKKRQQIRKKLNRLKRLTQKHKEIEFKELDGEILNDIEDYHHSYIKKQGYTDETLSYFKIGYARYGELSNRVIFPIDSPDGTIISASGRSVDESEPRYKIVNESGVKRTLYNISRIDKTLNYIIVTEGFKDVMFLHQEGYTNVVAAIGASLSDEQQRLLLRLAKNIIVIGDNDEAGKRFRQMVYNKMYKMLKVKMIDLGKITDVYKASICDLDFDEYEVFSEKLEEVISEL